MASPTSALPSGHFQTLLCLPHLPFNTFSPELRAHSGAMPTGLPEANPSRPVGCTCPGGASDSCAEFQLDTTGSCPADAFRCFRASSTAHRESTGTRFAKLNSRLVRVGQSSSLRSCCFSPCTIEHNQHPHDRARRCGWGPKEV